MNLKQARPAFWLLIGVVIAITCAGIFYLSQAPKSTTEVIVGDFRYNSIPQAQIDQVVASRDSFIFNAIKDPIRSAGLVNGKYALTIQRATDEQVQKGRLKADQKPALINALQGIIMIECGGDSLAVSRVGAVGIMQLLASTARENHLKVNKDYGRTERLLKKAKANNQLGYAELARIDERFDPSKAIRAGANYLVSLFRYYGRWDFAIAAYHGGMGNVDALIRSYLMADNQVTYFFGYNLKQDINRTGLSYPKIFLDNSPKDHPETYLFLQDYKSAEKDFSGWYFWNVTAAQKAVELSQKSPAAFKTKVEKLSHT